MTTYTARIMHDGPRFETIASGLPRVTSGYAHIIDYCTAHGLTIIYDVHDSVDDGWDVVAARTALPRGDIIYHFTVDKE